MLNKMVRPDSKGRITLGRLAEGVSSFSVKKYKDNRIILEPYTEVPLHEKWLFENKIALKKIERGIKETALNQVSKKAALLNTLMMILNNVFQITFY